jgi:hypothetical protein
MNEAYVGMWSFKNRLWQKVLGTNERCSHERNANEVIRCEYPEHRIIEVEVWDAVRARSAAVRARYTGKRKLPARIFSALQKKFSTPQRARVPP